MDNNAIFCQRVIPQFIWRFFLYGNAENSKKIEKSLKLAIINSDNKSLVG